MTTSDEGGANAIDGAFKIDGTQDNSYDKFSAESELTSNESNNPEDAKPTDKADYYYNDDNNEEEEEVTTKKSVSTLRNRRPSSARKSASQEGLRVLSASRPVIGQLRPIQRSHWLIITRCLTLIIGLQGTTEETRRERKSQVTTSRACQ